VTVDAAELLAGDHAGGAPAQRHLPVRQRLTLAERARQMEIMLSMALVERRGAGQRRRHVQAQHGEGLSHALAQARGRRRGLVQLAGQRAQLGLGVEGGVGVVGLPHLAADRARSRSGSRS
jgi:hypothetical protein